MIIITHCYCYCRSAARPPNLCLLSRPPRRRPLCCCSSREASRSSLAAGCLAACLAGTPSRRLPGQLNINELASRQRVRSSRYQSINHHHNAQPAYADGPTWAPWMMSHRRRHNGTGPIGRASGASKHLHSQALDVGGRIRSAWRVRLALEPARQQAHFRARAARSARRPASQPAIRRANGPKWAEITLEQIARSPELSERPRPSPIDQDLHPQVSVRLRARKNKRPNLGSPQTCLS